MSSVKLGTLTHLPATGFTTRLPRELDSARTLVLAFGSSDMVERPAPLHELAAAFPLSCLLGCSTAGEIAGTQISDGTVSAAIAQFDTTDLRFASTPLPSPQMSYEAGRILAIQLSVERHPSAVLVLSCGVGVNGSELIRGVNSITKGQVIVTGGLAGDGDRFVRTWVLDQGNLRDKHVTAVALYDNGGHLRVGFGSQGGWDIFGPERRVTRSTSNILYELDEKPALALYKRYLGDRATGLPATALLFPLAMRHGVGREHRLVRTVLSINEADQSMVFAGDIPEGATVQLMRANFERLIDGAAGAAEQVRAVDAGGQPTLAVAISCVGRRLVLGERAEEEVEVVRQSLSDATGLVGFYSYGEFSPTGGASCELHNQTMTLTTFTEV